MVVPQTIGFPIDNNLVWIILGSPILGNHHMYVCIYIYTLWFFNIAMENWPFIDGLPIKNGGSFHGYVK